jgi:methylamine dehydrogenase heavy chain
VLEVWDTQTLGFKYEVVLPPKRAQTLNYRGMVSVTGNGRFVLVQNATPATSITVVDLAEKKVATEVQTPVCWGSCSLPVTPRVLPCCAVTASWPP